MQIPASNLRTNRFHRLVGNCRAEIDEVLPFAILRSPRPKRVAQKIELLVRVRPSPILILAIDNLRLFGMKLQPTLLQASGYGRPNLLGFTSVLQCTMASSAKRSNGTCRYCVAIHRSNA